MRDNDLLRVLIPNLTAWLAEFVQSSNYAIEPPLVLQSYQPTQQGVPTAPTVFLHKIADHPYGYPRKEYNWHEDTQRMVYTDTQMMESTYQVNALFIQDPDNMVQLTATDLLQEVRACVQSDLFMQTLRDNDIGMERVMQVVQTYFYDDRDRQEASPSFDFTVTHKQVTIRNAPIAQSIEAGIYPI